MDKKMRILVVGLPGAGKTVLSDGLSSAFSLAVMHADEAHFLQDPSETATDIDHFFAQNDRLVLDGNYACCFRQAKRCHAIIVVNTPLMLRFARLLYRSMFDWLVLGEDNGTGLRPLSPFSQIRRFFFDRERSIFAQTLALTTHSELLSRNLMVNERIVYPVSNLEDAKRVVDRLLKTPTYTLSAIAREDQACALRKHIVRLAEAGELNAMWTDERANWFQVEKRRHASPSWTEIVERRLNNPRRVDRFAEQVVTRLGVNIFPVIPYVVAHQIVVFGCPHFKTTESDIDVLALVDDETFHAIQSQRVQVNLDDLLSRLVVAGNSARTIDLNVGVLDKIGQLKVTLKGRANMTQAIVASTMDLHVQPHTIGSKIILNQPTNAVTLPALTAALVHHIFAFIHIREYHKCASRNERYERAAQILEDWKTFAHTLRTERRSSFFKTLAMKVVQCALLAENRSLMFLKTEMASWSAQWNDATPFFLQRKGDSLSAEIIETTLRGYAVVLRNCFVKCIGMFKWKMQSLSTSNLSHPAFEQATLRAILHQDPTSFSKAQSAILHLPADTFSLPMTKEKHVPHILRPNVLFANGQRSKLWYEKYAKYERNGTLGVLPSRICLIRGCVAEQLLLPLIDFFDFVGVHRRLFIDALTDGRSGASPDMILWRDATSDAIVVEVKTMPSRPALGGKSYWRAIDISTKQIKSSVRFLPPEARAPYGIIVLLTPDTNAYYADITMVEVKS